MTYTHTSLGLARMRYSLKISLSRFAGDLLVATRSLFLFNLHIMHIDKGVSIRFSTADRSAGCATGMLVIATWVRCYLSYFSSVSVSASIVSELETNHAFVCANKCWLVLLQQ